MFKPFRCSFSLLFSFSVDFTDVFVRCFDETCLSRSIYAMCSCVCLYTYLNNVLRKLCLVCLYLVLLYLLSLLLSRITQVLLLLNLPLSVAASASAAAAATIASVACLMELVLLFINALPVGQILSADVCACNSVISDQY